MGGELGESGEKEVQREGGGRERGQKRIRRRKRNGKETRDQVHITDMDVQSS